MVEVCHRSQELSVPACPFILGCGACIEAKPCVACQACRAGGLHRGAAVEGPSHCPPGPKCPSDCPRGAHHHHHHQGTTTTTRPRPTCPLLLHSAPLCALHPALRPPAVPQLRRRLRPRPQPLAPSNSRLSPPPPTSATAIPSGEAFPLTSPPSPSPFLAAARSLLPRLPSTLACPAQWRGRPRFRLTEKLVDPTPRPPAARTRATAPLLLVGTRYRLLANTAFRTVSLRQSTQRRPLLSFPMRRP